MYKRQVEQNGFRRGGLIRDLDAFYETDFYRMPQEKNGYPIWLDGHGQSGIFYRDEQSVYGFGNIITMAVAVYEPSDRHFLGVLLFNIDLNAFSDCIRDYHSYAYEGGNTFLVGEDGALSWYSPSIQAPSFPQDSRLFAQMPVSYTHLPSTLGTICRKIAQKLDGFEGFHFHQLRHTYTSNLLANGAAPKDVQELLGHSDVSTTMNVYAHSTRKAKRESARLLDKVAGND